MVYPSYPELSCLPPLASARQRCHVHCCMQTCTGITVLPHRFMLSYSFRSRFGCLIIAHLACRSRVKTRQHVNPLSASFQAPAVLPERWFQSSFENPSAPLLVDIGKDSIGLCVIFILVCYYHVSLTRRHEGIILYEAPYISCLEPPKSNSPQNDFLLLFVEVST